MVHSALQKLLGLQSAHGVVKSVFSQALHELLLEVFALPEMIQRKRAFIWRPRFETFGAEIQRVCPS